MATQPPGTLVADGEDVEPPAEAYDNPPQEGAEENENEDHWISVLQAPTPQSEIHQKGVWANRQPVMNPDGTAKTLAYVTARFVQDRLDEAVGPANWQVVFESVPNSTAVRAGIGLNVGDGEDWIWKWDVGVPSSIEADKGAHSDAFKRAGVQWGIARDLYDERDDKDFHYDVPQAQQAQAAPMQPYPPNMDAPPAVLPRGAGQTIQQQVQGPPMQGQPQQQYAQQPYVENGQAPAWACPIHNDVKVVPGGISKRTGRQYNAFYACPVPGCDQKGPSA
jgi:hypothetical protein